MGAVRVVPHASFLTSETEGKEGGTGAKGSQLDERRGGEGRERTPKSEKEREGGSGRGGKLFL